VEYDYAPSKADELPLFAGEKVLVTSVDIGVRGWYSGVNSRGDTGIFPANYVRLISGGKNEVEEKKKRLAAIGVRVGVGLGALFSPKPPSASPKPSDNVRFLTSPIAYLLSVEAYVSN
jgi:hypothetical protein